MPSAKRVHIDDQTYHRKLVRLIYFLNLLANSK